LFCEPLVRLTVDADVREGVLEGVRRFGSLGAHVLKIQFPADTAREPSRAAWADACAEANELCPVPWALLSEGREFDTFRELLVIACRAGASGFVAGRAIWGIGGGSEGDVAVARTRLTQLRTIAIAQGVPWRRHVEDRSGQADITRAGSVPERTTEPRGELGGGGVL
jgi:tagatose 1,6-diphosphate aldolase